MAPDSAASRVAAVVACAAAVYVTPLCVAAFTAPQADRGLRAYERSCTKCHQSDLQGNQEVEAPALAGDAFMSRWRGQATKDLFEKVSTKMPADQPGSLPADAYLDIVAYLLQANKFPSGNDELSLAPDSLAQVISEPARPAGRTSN
jgi:cytochrome c